MSHSCVINCYTCKTCVWEGGQATPDEILGLPFGDLSNPDGSTINLRDGQDLLTHYANAHCTRQDCPHTPTAIETVHINSPEGLAAQIAELRAKFASLDHGEG